MKKTYETPSIEVVKFQYRNQVVAASGCTTKVANDDLNSDGTCDTESEIIKYHN